MQEQDRQIQLYSSSKDDYLSKMVQLEEKFSSLFKISEDTTENIERLEANGLNKMIARIIMDVISLAVMQAKELHQQLQYTNTHLNCELQQARSKLECCQQELVESRTREKTMELESKESGDAQGAELKAAKQELKMVS